MSKCRSKAHEKAQRRGKLRDRNTCQICGSKKDVEAHHIIDLYWGGAANDDNIITLCRKHHRDVHEGRINIIKF